MNEERITDIFHQLRELPTDMSLGEVEHWARLHAAGELVPQSPSLGGGSSFPFKPTLYMTSIITAAAATGLAALIAINGSDDGQQPNAPSSADTQDSTITLSCDTPSVKVNMIRAPQGDSSLQQITILAPRLANVMIEAYDSTGSRSFSFDGEGRQRASLSSRNAFPSIAPLSPVPPSAAVSENAELGDAAKQALANAKQVLLDAKRSLKEAQQALAEAQQQNNSAQTLSDAYQELADAQEIVAQAQEELEQTRQELQDEAQAYASCSCNNNSDSVKIGIEKQLLKDGLIQNVNDYLLELSNKKLSINGKGQPAEVHQRYMQLYIQLNGGHWSSGSSFTYMINVRED